jgi:hypothetical protein
MVLGKKRKYEDDESDVECGCRENDKMFKCNYWEDPAFAKELQRDGLQRARVAALDNQTERLLMLLESAGRRSLRRSTRHPQQQPPPGSISPIRRQP